MASYTLHFDGSCWPNPGGTAAYGTVVKKDGVRICAEAGVLGTSNLMSNNVAEFHALSVGLQRVLESGPLKGDDLRVFGDSNLVIQMMNGVWRPKADKLYYPYWGEAASRHDKLEERVGVSIAYKWIPREQNTECDDLSKEHNHAPK